MCVRTYLVGLIEMDASAGVASLFDNPPKRDRANCVSPENYDESNGDVMVADLHSLRQELVCELQRILDRLAA
jgi:hypothetical protein